TRKTGLLAERYFIRKFVCIAGFVIWEMSSQLLTSEVNAFDEALCKFSLAKMGCHHFLGALPKISCYRRIDALITKDSKLVIQYRQIDQDTIPVFGLIHLQCLKDLSSPIQDIGFAVIFDVNLDLSGSPCLSRLDGSGDLSLFFRRK